MNYRTRHQLMTLARKHTPATAHAIKENAKMTAARKIDALNTARTIAKELGQNPDSKGTARLAEDLSNQETGYTVHQHEGTDLSPFPVSVYSPEGEIAAIRNHGKDTARIAYMFAASPELLQACGEMVVRWENISDESVNLMADCDQYELARGILKLRAAIAKATKG